MSQQPYEVVYLDGEQETVNFIKRSGSAKVMYANGDVYEGPFNEDGEKHGEGGKYMFASRNEDAEGAVYEGSYSHGKRSGLGTMRYENGGKYCGMWKQGLRHGKGSMTYGNNDIYSGGWKNDERSGTGTYLFAESGARAVGTWESGQIVTGKFIHADGTEYTGSFAQNRFSGKGQYKFQSSSILLHGEFIERIIQDSEGMTEPVWIGNKLA